MALSATVAYLTFLGLTVVFTVLSLTIRGSLWRVALKLVAGLFWVIMALGQFIFFGADSEFIVLSFAYGALGMLFWFAILHDFLSEKKDRLWKFEE